MPLPLTSMPSFIIAGESPPPDMEAQPASKDRGRAMARISFS